MIDIKFIYAINILPCNVSLNGFFCRQLTYNKYYASENLRAHQRDTNQKGKESGVQLKFGNRQKIQ